MTSCLQKMLYRKGFVAVLSLIVSQAQTSSRKVNVHFQFPWLHAETHTCRVRGYAKKNPHISTLAYPLTSPMCLRSLYLARNQGAVTQADGSKALQDSDAVRVALGLLQILVWESRKFLQTLERGFWLARLLLEMMTVSEGRIVTA